MQVPFLDLKKQYQSIKDEINPAIQEVLDNTAFILGKSVKEFETEFAKLHNVNFCIATSSGTDANHLTLWASGIGPGDEVIIPANTFIATAWGAVLCGATPVFVDCDPLSYTLDPQKIEEAITPRTRAIVPVHLYGQAADMDAINEIAARHNLLVFEDAAQAHLSEYKNRRVGGLSLAASFSFYPGKNLGAYGEGGAVVTNDFNLAETFRKMREHGQSEKYYHDSFGHNYRMEGMQGAILKVKLNYIEGWTNSRRTVANKYNFLLQDLDNIILPREMHYAKHVYHLFVIQVAEGQEMRNKLAKFLNDKGVSTGLHYPVPLHLQKCFSHLDYMRGDFPVTEKLAESGLSLPMYPELTDDQIEYVAGSIKQFFMEQPTTIKAKEYTI